MHYAICIVTFILSRYKFYILNIVICVIDVSNVFLLFAVDSSMLISIGQII